METNTNFTPPAAPTPSKINYILLGVLVLVIIGSVLAVKYFGNSGSQPAQQNDQTQTTQTGEHSNVVKKDVDVAKLPDKFPTNIPLEAGAKIDQNYTATTDAGQFQATRAFQTAKSLDENYKLYSDFLKKSGWTVIANVDQPKIKVLGAKKGNAFLQININENSVTHVKTVNISYSETPVGN